MELDHSEASYCSALLLDADEQHCDRRRDDGMDNQCPDDVWYINVRLDLEGRCLLQHTQRCVGHELHSPASEAVHTHHEHLDELHMPAGNNLQHAQHLLPEHIGVLLHLPPRAACHRLRDDAMLAPVPKLGKRVAFHDW